MIRFPFSRPQLTVPKFHCARAATHHKNIATMLTTLHKNTIKSTLITHDSASFSIWIKPIVDKSLTQQQFCYHSLFSWYFVRSDEQHGLQSKYDPNCAPFFFIMLSNILLNKINGRLFNNQKFKCDFIVLCIALGIVDMLFCIN